MNHSTNAPGESPALRRSKVTTPDAATEKFLADLRAEARAITTAQIVQAHKARLRAWRLWTAIWRTTP